MKEKPFGREIVCIEPCGQESMRLTEDPAGLPYKLASRWIEQLDETIG
jgi:hypothetical protein